MTGMDSPVAARYTRLDGTWSCVRDGATEPCEDCDGCRSVEAENRTLRLRPDGLTAEEGIVSDRLVEAVEAWARLPRQHPQEINEFVDAVHRCQGLLTTRIARRHYPDGWPVKP